MTPHEKNIRELVLEWVSKAEDDLLDAEVLISYKRPRLDGTAFHCQQCAEKYLKAFLVAREVEFPKTHEIKELLELVETADAALAESLGDATALTPYGVVIRYPTDFPKVSPDLAKEAFELALKVKDAVRAALGEDWIREAGDER